MKLVCIGLFLAPALGLALPPEALIAQGSVPSKKGQPDPNVQIADTLEDQITRDGRLNGILWSIGDPMFRAAVDDGVIKNPPDFPSLREAYRVARALHAEYLIYLTAATQKDGSIDGAITIYQGSRQVWHNSQRTGLQNPSGTDVNGTILAITSNWINLMDAGPLKGFAVTPVISTPPPEPGEIKTPPPSAVPTIAPPPMTTPSNKGTDNTELFHTVDGFIKTGDLSDAVQALRDGVDTAPLDLERRRRLCETLLLAGEPVLAAQEARRGAVLLPQGGVLRLIAIRAWLLAGQGSEAQNDLNELASHSPGGADPLLLAEVALFQMKVSSAIDTLDSVIQTKATPDAYYFRALAKGLQGDDAGVQADLAQIGSDGSPARYTIATSILDASVQTVGDEVRALLNDVAVKPSGDVGDGLKFQIGRTTATLDFLQGIQPDPLHKHSQARRILAYNLLQQSLGDIQEFLSTRNDDTLSDARLNFSEALRNFSGAREDFLGEAKGTANDRPATG